MAIHQRGTEIVQIKMDEAINNIIVYSFSYLENTFEESKWYWMLRYSLKTLEDVGNTIPVQVYVSKKDVYDKLSEDFKNIQFILFDNEYANLFSQTYRDYGKMQFHKVINVFNCYKNFNPENILYVDVDTIWYQNPKKIFDKYSNTEYVWACPDNVFNLHKLLNLEFAMNDGVFLINPKKCLNLNFDWHLYIKNYIDEKINYLRNKLNDKDFVQACWVTMQYGNYKYFIDHSNGVRYFDELDVIISNKIKDVDKSKVIIHHYLNSEYKEYVPAEYCF